MKIKQYIFTSFALISFFSFFSISQSFYFIEPQTSINLIGTPGKTYDQKIKIYNNEDKIVTLDLYSGDSVTTIYGQETFTDKSETNIGLGKWIQIQNNVTLNPKESKEIPFKIIIPKNITPGAYSGGILISKQNKKEVIGTGMSFTIRTGKKITIDIPGEKFYNFYVNNFSLQKNEKDKRTDFLISVSNSGNTISTLTGAIDIYNSKEELIDSIPVNTVQLQPSSTNDLNYTWNKFPYYGNFTAKLKVQYGEYSIKDRKIINEKTEEKIINFSFFPYKTALWSGLFLLIIVSFVAIRMYLNKKFIDSCIKYTVLENENIETIAKIVNNDWKKLAKINNLSAPYNLQAGQTILVYKNEKK